MRRPWVTGSTIVGILVFAIATHSEAMAPASPNSPAAGATQPPGDPCSPEVVTCTNGNGTVVVGEQPLPGGPVATVVPVSGAPQPTVVWTDCGPNLGPQVVSAADVGPCFAPLQACPLPRGMKADPNVHVFLVTTTYPDGTKTARNECTVDVRGRQPQLAAADIEKWLVRQIPVGSIGTPNPKSLVNLKTIFWVDTKPTYQWGPMTLVQANVRIRVTLDHVHWTFGDGASVDAPDVGRPYDPAAPCDARCADHFGHAYTTSKGVMSVHAQTFWRAEFSVNGGAFVALPQPVPANPMTPIQVTIVEARSQLVAPR
jgi:hypothetical protein